MEENWEKLMIRLLAFAAAVVILCAAILCYPLPRRGQKTAVGSPFSSSLVIDLNEADEQTLCLLPGVGEKRAADIIAYREEIGGFASLEDLLEIPGISDKSIESWREYIVLH